jgi:hypothetical protein
MAATIVVPPEDGKSTRKLQKEEDRDLVDDIRPPRGTISIHDHYFYMNKPYAALPVHIDCPVCKETIRSTESRRFIAAINLDSCIKCRAVVHFRCCHQDQPSGHLSCITCHRISK